MVLCSLKTHRGASGGLEVSYVGLGLLVGEVLSIALKVHFP